MHTRSCAKKHLLMLGIVFGLFVAASEAWSQQARVLTGTGPIREKPPGELATILRRDPDFSTVRFLGMQRSYREELRAKLMMGHAAIRLGRQVAPMQPIMWPPQPAE